MTFVSHLECGLTGERFEAGRVWNLSSAGKPLLVRYDLDRLRESVSIEALRNHPPGLWRYRDFLPVTREENRVTLGEVETPLIPLANLFPGGNVIVKDESRLPTGSFKARGLCLAVSMAKELGISRLAMPTNGNAGAALSAYASRAGIESIVLCPDDTPQINIRETAFQGGDVAVANGLIHECGRYIGANKEANNWFDVSTLKEPYRIEGKKTMGLELADQCEWRLPAAIFYPTGGGTGLIGMWKAFQELREIGWVTGPLPKMIAVQAEGCAPMVRAFEKGEEFAQPWENATTVAMGIRVPAAIGDFLILRAVRESEGVATAVSDDAILSARERCARSEGLLLCPEGAATLAAYEQQIAAGTISPSDEVVLFNCATGLKYPLPEVGKRIAL